MVQLLLGVLAFYVLYEVLLSRGLLKGPRRLPEPEVITVVVTGAASGIGLGLTQELLRRSETEPIKVIAIDLFEMELEHDNLTTFRASVTYSEALQKVADSMKEKNIACDALCCCAGLTVTGPLVELDSRTVKTVLDVNTFGAWN